MQRELELAHFFADQDDQLKTRRRRMDAAEAISVTNRISSRSQPSGKAPPSDRWLLPWLFVAPALFIYVVVVVYPMVFSVYLSFFRWDGIAPTKAFVGLHNYVALFANDRVFWIV